MLNAEATTSYVNCAILFFSNGPFPASFSVFSSFQYTVDSKQMFNINKFLPMTGFEPRTCGIGSDRSTNWAITTAYCAILLGRTLSSEGKHHLWGRLGGGPTWPPYTRTIVVWIPLKPTYSLFCKSRLKRMKLNKKRPGLAHSLKNDIVTNIWIKSLAQSRTSCFWSVHHVHQTFSMWSKSPTSIWRTVWPCVVIKIAQRF